MKWIKYTIMEEYDYGTAEDPDVRQVFNDAQILYTGEASIQDALKESYNGEYQIIDIPDPRPLPEIQSSRQEENKAALSSWLSDHPLKWTDGKLYGVEEEDQTEIALNWMQYQVAKAAGEPAVLEWHAKKEECRPFDESEFTDLSLTIADYVYPYRRYEEKIKAAIYNAQTVADIESIEIDYSTVAKE